MAIDFTLTAEQQKLQADVGTYAENVLAPDGREADPLKGFQRTKPAYVEAYKAGIAMCFLPRHTVAAASPTSTSSSPPRDLRG